MSAHGRLLLALLIQWRELAEKTIYKIKCIDIRRDIAQGRQRRRTNKMGRIFKYIGYLAVLGFLALVGYAYLGPYLGADFSPDQVEVTKPVTLDVD